MQGLYAIVDVGAVMARGWDVRTFSEAILAEGPVALQLRDKRRAAGQTLTWLRALAPSCRAAGVALIANDRPDLAALAGCAGLHLGQSDLPPAEARDVLASFPSDEGGPARCAIGMSVHDHDELSRALAAKPDYLAFGPVFGTRSKAQPEPTIALEGLASLVAAARARFDGPLVAIGGIDVDNVDLVLTQVDAVAVISALLPAADCPSPYAQAAARTRALVAKLPEAAWI